MPDSTRMPALFLGHGSPTNALEDNRFTRAWAELGRTLPRPRAILAVSAHWYVDATAVTAAEEPRTIHDFGGFGPELNALQYPAPGDPELAERVVEVLDPTPTYLDDGRWGLDHGTWSLLVHLFPEADVPVVQLSIDANRPPVDHVELGAALAPLRDEGVLILGSGNVVHNLGLIEWNNPSGADWNLEFDAAATELMTTRPGDIADLVDHRVYRRAVPTPEHLLPLFYVAGLARAADTTAEVVVEGSIMGSLSMTSYRVD